MLRGEFHCQNGLILPNNITEFGARMILDAAFSGANPEFFIALVSGNAEATLQLESLTESTLATNGYDRKAVPRTTVAWPNTGSVNGEQYIESDWQTWAALAGDFDQPITRMALVPSQTDLTGDVYALSAAMPTGLVITPTTPAVDRTFKYRVYLR